MSLSRAFFRRVIAPLWAVKERSPYIRIAARLERDARIDPELRRERQLARLRAMVDYAGRQSPFYARRFREAGFQPGDLRGWDDLARLPVLTKAEVRAHADALRARSFRGAVHPKKTSGSTGVSLHFQVDDGSVQWKRGVMLWRDEWTGWRLGEPSAMIWGNPVLPRTARERFRNRFLERLFYLDTLAMDGETMEAFADEVVRRRPTLLFGHAHSLYLFARHWSARPRPPVSLKAALSTAMVLRPHERKGVEEAFGIPVFDRYGCEEVSLIASECEAHRGLHVNGDTLVVEVDEDRPGSGEGRVLVTDLTNRAMPFIRYEVGDRAVPAAGPCPCGRTYPRLETVAGRIADYLRTLDGRLVSGISLTENFATLIPGVEQVQIIQDRRDHLRLRLVLAPDFGGAGRARIASLVRERFGEGMAYDIEPVDRIAPEASGKYRFAVNAIEAPGRP